VAAATAGDFDGGRRLGDQLSGGVAVFAVSRFAGIRGAPLFGRIGPAEKENAQRADGAD
jgi:hypothetical protein